MLSAGIAVAVGVLYWLAQYELAFWILILAIANGCLGAAYAVINPDWYNKKVLTAGAEPNYTHLFVSKLIVLAVLIPITWYVGILAGYIPISLRH
jgi:hypothetical protein